MRRVAVHLKLLPARAIRLADARDEYRQREKHHELRTARRRILFELTKAPRPGAEREPLRKATREWGRDAGELVDVAVQVWSPDDFNAALDQLVAAGDVKATETTPKTGDTPITRYTITAAGKKTLAAAPGPPPLLEDIDADSPAPALPGGTPATDELQDDDDLPDLVVGGPPALVGKLALAPGSRRTKVLELIAATPGITIPELADKMVLKQNALYRLLPELADDGLVRKDGRGWHPAAVGAIA